jgi:hypothetical protein
VRRSGDAVSKLDWAGDGAAVVSAPLIPILYALAMASAAAPSPRARTLLRSAGHRRGDDGDGNRCLGIAARVSWGAAAAFMGMILWGIGMGAPEFGHARSRGGHDVCRSPRHDLAAR